MYTETNKKLAEFLGWEKRETYLNKGDKKEQFYSTPFIREYYNEALEAWDTTDIFRPEELLFNVSWNWLLRVVEEIKVSEKEYNQEGIKLLSIIYDTLTDTNITNTYNACVKFVEWYNKEQAVFKGRGLFDVMEDVGKIFGGQINKKK